MAPLRHGISVYNFYARFHATVYTALMCTVRPFMQHARSKGAVFVSNSAMTQAHPTLNDSQQATEQRLIDLEIKASYTEDQLEQLDRVVVRQQQQIDLLMREVACLREQPKDGDVVVGRSLRDELPPHF